MQHKTDKLLQVKQEKRKRKYIREQIAIKNELEECEKRANVRKEREA